jgi:REP element-mobilizing transposase RayT
MRGAFKPRLRRLDWVFTDCPVYYLTLCALDRRPILANDEIHASFGEFARKATDLDVLVGRYVIMPDHIHFFAAFSPQSPSLSMWIKSWKNSLSKTLRRMGISPRHWEKDFFDHVLRSEESYEQKWVYVRENPVRAGLVKRWEDWPYQGEIHRLTVRKL